METIEKIEQAKLEQHLKLQALQLKVAFNDKGIKHIWDFIQGFYPNNKFDKDSFGQFISGRQANIEFIKILTDILHKLPL